MNQTQIETKTARYLSTFLEKEGFVLLKTEYVKEDGINYLRAYIDLTDEEKEERKKAASAEDSEPGIGINDCAKVSRRLSKWLDKEDFIPEEYMLEVCSRGYLTEEVTETSAVTDET